MKEYIEREAAIESMYKDAEAHPDHTFWTTQHEALLTIPAADVRLVVRAKWEVGGMFDDIGRCSNCHYMFPIDTAMTEFHFCPNCGADMREES